MKEIEAIPAEHLAYLKSKGFEGRTLEEAFDWIYIKQGLFCDSRTEDPTLDCLVQLIKILKIRNF